MTRTEYLTQLELYLKKLPQADQIEAMDYFRELFDDAGVEGEEELIASLGTPKEAAHEVLSNLLDKKIKFDFFWLIFLIFNCLSFRGFFKNIFLIKKKPFYKIH